MKKQDPGNHIPHPRSRFKISILPLALISDLSICCCADGKHRALYFVLTAILLYNTICLNSPTVSWLHRCWSLKKRRAKTLFCCFPELQVNMYICYILCIWCSLRNTVCPSTKLIRLKFDLRLHIDRNRKKWPKTGTIDSTVLHPRCMIPF